MIQVVDNKDIIGYISNNTFIPHSILSNIVVDIKIDKTISGYDKSLISSDKDWLLDLKSVKSDLNLKPISFIHRKPDIEEISEFSLSQYWKIADLDRRFVYTVVDEGLKILGYFVTDSDIFNSFSCCISMLEIVNKGVGTGTKIVSELKRLANIKGYSCVSAHDFWKKNGAIFYDGEHFEIPIDM